MPLKMLHADLLLVENEAARPSAFIYTPDPKKGDQKILLYTVCEVGPKAKQVKKGDIVGVSWTDATIPFEYEGTKYVLSDESKVHFVKD